MTKTIAGVEFHLPTVTLLQETGIGTAEIAARTCYDSFDNSENECVTMFNLAEITSGPVKELANEVNNIEHSDLLDTLAWTHFHHSILEHANLTYLIKGTDRGVLQEHSRHRIQGISVRSTRYTMSSVLNAYIAASYFYGNVSSITAKSIFARTIEQLGVLNYVSYDMIYIEAEAMYNKLYLQVGTNYDSMLSKDGRAKFDANKDDKDAGMFSILQTAKKKRNVGDAFKHIVTDNWKVDMVVTMNLRALKNYLDLRDSGAAYEHIRWLAQAIKAVTPSKYLDLIVKG